MGSFLFNIFLFTKWRISLWLNVTVLKCRNGETWQLLLFIGPAGPMTRRGCDVTNACRLDWWNGDGCLFSINMLGNLGRPANTVNFPIWVVGWFLMYPWKMSSDVPHVFRSLISWYFLNNSNDRFWFSWPWFSLHYLLQSSCYKMTLFLKDHIFW